MNALEKRQRIIFYHRTNRQAAEAILKSGFRDGAGCYMTDVQLTGVWLSEDPNEGAGGDVLLKVIVPLREEELDYYEVKEEGKPFRGWLFPAILLNARMDVSVIEGSSL